MWHETILTKESREKVHASQTHPCVGNASIPSSTPPVFRQSNQWHRRHDVANGFIATTQA
jgi:hypothetical protein